MLTCFSPTGYPRDFAEKTGLIDSELGGTCTPNPTQPGVNENRESDPDVGVPFADSDPPPQPPQQNQPPPEAEEDNELDIDELNERFANLDVSAGDEMRVKLLLIKDVPIRHDVAKHRDLLAVQIVLPPGAVMSTLTVKPYPEQPSKVKASVDIDPHVSNAAHRTKRDWETGNPLLCSQMEAGLDTSCKADMVPGTNHERVMVDFEWPDGVESELNPLDPAFIYFRLNPTRPGQSLFETQRIRVRGVDGKQVVPIFTATAFFVVAGARHFEDRGELELSDSNDEDDQRGDGGSPNSRKRPARGGGGDTNMPDAKPSPTPNRASSGGNCMPGATTLGVIMGSLLASAGAIAVNPFK